MYHSAESLGAAIALAKTHVVEEGIRVDTGHWQGVKTEGKPDLVTTEIVGYSFDAPIPDSVWTLQNQVQPNLPWAENHFAERVSRDPSNPGEEYKNWPWWKGQVDETQEQGKFTHTYQERFWPKDANQGRPAWGLVSARLPHRGIRYPYGDLDDVVDLLVKEPYTRQAYLPIFFPEDIGAVHGGRIPCSLGYHFMRRFAFQRDNLHIFYAIRSCDLVRHFQDDVYLAARLCQWVIDECGRREFDTDERVHNGERTGVWDGRFNIKPGLLHMSISSLHFHEGDRRHLDT